ncbi:MAG: xanthine dehydrogenase accessory protein XdhC [Betaproteobacteria bacterium HGW-Betaproteobacteria-3]|nr:MAG: xanthine dehydrogenase accessory protein XdhC [Betaproteobacteria bacterium HGW-Betaproteobacteria-3]
MNRIDEFATRLAAEPAVLVTVASTRGSVPRERGTWMAVFAQGVVGTIGGGQLEFQAIARARAQLGDPGAKSLFRYTLGASLGQCCGGEVHLRLETLAGDDASAVRKRLVVPQTPVALFGGGHVGTALVNVLASLPFAVNWIDSRDGVFPDDVPDRVRCEHSDPVQGAVPGLASGTRVLIMSFSHAEDLDIVAACLARQRAQGDLPYVGLIGSKTKWATFRHRLEARGYSAAELSHVTSPIGVPGIAGKAPEVIAVAVAAQLLQTLTPGNP